MDTTNKLAYSYRDAAEALSISIRTIQRAAERGELAVKYVGTKPVIPAEELQAWLGSLPSEAPGN